MESRGTTPRLSVLIVTYNHERFIGQAIESALMQETNFPFEIVIGEDCSTDRTRAIVSDYAERYRDKIRLVLQEKNVGGAANFDRTLAQCQGEFIAILEGDDFWASRNKLQIQVTFLDRHKDCPLCFHSVQVILEDGKGGSLPSQIFPALTQQEWSTPEDLLRGNFISTCSVLYRRVLLPTRPKWLANLTPNDWLMWILIGEHGRIGYIPEILATYRVHQGGMWSTRQQKAIEKTLETLRIAKGNLSTRYQALIEQTISFFEFVLCEFFAKQKRYREARSAYLNYRRNRKLGNRISLAAELKLFLKLYLPGFAAALRIMKSLVDRASGNVPSSTANLESLGCR